MVSTEEGPMTRAAARVRKRPSRSTVSTVSWASTSAPSKNAPTTVSRRRVRPRLRSARLVSNSPALVISKTAPAFPS